MRKKDRDTGETPGISCSLGFGAVVLSLGRDDRLRDVDVRPYSTRGVELVHIEVRTQGFHLFALLLVQDEDAIQLIHYTHPVNWAFTRD